MSQLGQKDPLAGRDVLAGRDPLAGRFRPCTAPWLRGGWARWASLCAAWGVLGLAACQEPPPGSWPPVNLFEAGAGERTFRSVQYDTLWSYGEGDSVLASVFGVDATPTGDAVVLDFRGQQVHRISAEGVAWTWGSRGQGPGELGNVRAMAVNGSGEVVLGDSGNRRLTWLSLDGRWLRDAPIPPPAAGGFYVNDVTGIVPLEGGGYILSRTAAEPWVRLSESGEREGVVPAPWEGFDQMHPLQTYGQVAGGSKDRWVFGFSVGSGFFAFDGAEPAGSYPYVEHADFPALVTTRQSGGYRISYTARPRTTAQDIEVRGDTAVVLVDSDKLDYYHVVTGRYVGTIRLPGPSRGFAFTGDALLSIDDTGMFPTITALKARSQEP